MPADSMRPRPLGSSGMTVSAMSLGSWRTFERLPPETGAAILAAARDEGINFFDDARYNDETGRAPLPTGYSEVLFGELFRSAGVHRDEVVVANKLWWEFWPEQSAAAELDGSLPHGLRPRGPHLREPAARRYPRHDMVAAVGLGCDSGKVRRGRWSTAGGPTVEAAAAAAAWAWRCRAPAVALLAWCGAPAEGAEMTRRCTGGRGRGRLVLPGRRGAQRKVSVRRRARAGRRDAG